MFPFLTITHEEVIAMKRNSFLSIRLLLAISILAALVALALPVGVKTASAETEVKVKVSIVNHVGCKMRITIWGPGLPSAGQTLIIPNNSNGVIRLRPNKVYTFYIKSKCCGNGGGKFN